MTENADITDIINRLKKMKANVKLMIEKAELIKTKYNYNVKAIQAFENAFYNWINETQNQKVNNDVNE